VGQTIVFCRLSGGWPGERLTDHGQRWSVPLLSALPKFHDLRSSESLLDASSPRDSACAKYLAWDRARLRRLVAFVYKKSLVIFPVGHHDPYLFAELIGQVRPEDANVFVGVSFGEID